MSTINQASDLKALSHSISLVHKSLIQFQKEVFEELEGRKLSVYDVLHLVMNHPDFEWLKTLSTLLISIDETLDDQKADLSEFKKGIVSELNVLFNGTDQHEGFKTRLENALKRDQNLCLQVADLKKRMV